MQRQIAFLRRHFGGDAPLSCRIVTGDKVTVGAGEEDWTCDVLVGGEWMPAWFGDVYDCCRFQALYERSFCADS